MACAAYENRAGKQPPRIVAAKFVEPGCYDEVVLKEYPVRVLEAKQTITQGKQTKQTTEKNITDLPSITGTSNQTTQGQESYHGYAQIRR